MGGFVRDWELREWWGRGCNGPNKAERVWCMGKERATKLVLSAGRIGDIARSAKG